MIQDLGSREAVVFVEFGTKHWVQLDCGRSIEVPDIPFPLRESDWEVWQTGEDLSVGALVEGALSGLAGELEPEAVESFRRFLFQVEPNVDQLLVAQALTFLGEGRLIEATQRFRTLVQLCPDHAQGWMNLGLCLMDLAKGTPRRRTPYRKQAIEALETSIQIDPRLGPALFYLGCIYRDLGDPIRARKLWRRCVSTGIRDEEVARSARQLLATYEERHGLDECFEMGCLAVLEGRCQEGARLLTRVVASRPDCWESNYFLGLAFVRLGDYHRAEERFQEVLRIRPEEWQVWGEIGVCQLEQNQLEAAKESLERCLSFDPENVSSLYNLGFVHLRRGDSEAARSVFELARSLDEDGLIPPECLELLVPENAESTP